MKTIRQFLKNNRVLLVILASFFATTGAVVVAQHASEGPVKVKVVKIIDGDTTIIEKTMDESGVQDFTESFQNMKGKNVQVMITVQDLNKEKKGPMASKSMNFNFNMPSGDGNTDSLLAHCFAKSFVFNDSTFSGNFCWNDSLFSQFHKGFHFEVDMDKLMQDLDLDIRSGDDGKNVIIRNGKGKTIIIKNDDADDMESLKEDPKAKTNTQSKSIIIRDEKGKDRKKVIVSTSVTVIDLDQKKEDDVYESVKKKRGEEPGFSFYPNPSDGTFTLDLELKNNDPALVSITDLNGTEIYHETVKGDGRVSKVINLKDRKGTFIVVIKQNKRTTSKKIIIE